MYQKEKGKKKKKIRIVFLLFHISFRSFSTSRPCFFSVIMPPPCGLCQNQVENTFVFFDKSSWGDELHNTQKATGRPVSVKRRKENNMDKNTILAKISEIETQLVELKNELLREVNPIHMVGVSFFAGARVYAYRATSNIAEGDVVMVPTASRGNIPGVVVFAEDYSEETVPFHGMKEVIDKLENLNLPASELIRMTNEIAGAVAAKEDAKSRFIAFMERRNNPAPAVEEPSNDDTCSCSCSDCHTSLGDSWDDDDEGEWEGDGQILPPVAEPSANEPETTVTDTTVSAPVAEEELPFN